MTRTFIPAASRRKPDRLPPVVESHDRDVLDEQPWATTAHNASTNPHCATRGGTPSDRDHSGRPAHRVATHTGHLQAVQCRIAPPTTQQLMVRAALDDATGFDVENHVRP